ncbi:accessory gland protein Acp29AB-like [Drosophila sulfurigaster albostrigata]|uniref:accessory gland protein Acp29AB-like n=1 Tax=Drosophila sulfurigaster albostrigata TaxID=89887 RepID=UPI002D21C7C5|nr:accessory gland protein Acp29AB-like [Drosophila sulfurigaster albostrigata]
MNIFFGLLACLFVLSGNAQKPGVSNQLQAICGQYCLKPIQALVEYAKNLQSEVKQLKLEADKPCASKTVKKLETQEENADLNLTNMRLVASTLQQQLSRLSEKIQERLAKINDYFALPYKKIGSKYYYIEDTEKVNWFKAVSKCLALGGHLVSIKNEDEFNAIKEKLQANKNYWIDINDLAKEGEFISIATGQKPSYVNWHPNEPNNQNNNEHCGELWYKKEVHLMNDSKCGRKKLFICEPHNQLK